MMPKDTKYSPLREALLAEVAEELDALDGAELDKFLLEIGEDPDRLVQQGGAALSAALAARGRRRFEDARAQLKTRTPVRTASIVTLDVAKKRALLEAIRVHGEKTGQMTLAARNRKIESEADLDSFLEACLKLGVIDENGEIKS